MALMGWARGPFQAGLRAVALARLGAGVGQEQCVEEVLVPRGSSTPKLEGPLNGV